MAYSYKTDIPEKYVAVDATLRIPAPYPYGGCHEDCPMVRLADDRARIKCYMGWARTTTEGGRKPGPKCPWGK